MLRSVCANVIEMVSSDACEKENWLLRILCFSQNIIITIPGNTGTESSHWLQISFLYLDRKLQRRHRAPGPQDRDIYIRKDQVFLQHCHKIPLIFIIRLYGNER